MVYEWLCGTRPFEGSLTEVMVQHLTIPPAPLHEKVATIPPELEQVVRGGTWTMDFTDDPDSLIPNGGSNGPEIEMALYLPLFYGDAQGMIQPGAASEVPTVQNGGKSDFTQNSNLWPRGAAPLKAFPTHLCQFLPASIF